MSVSCEEVKSTLTADGDEETLGAVPVSNQSDVDRTIDNIWEVCGDAAAAASSGSNHASSLPPEEQSSEHRDISPIPAADPGFRSAPAESAFRPPAAAVGFGAALAPAFGVSSLGVSAAPSSGASAASSTGASAASSTGASAGLAFGAPAAAPTLGARSIGFGSAPAAGSFGAPAASGGAPAPAFGTRSLGVAAAPSSGTSAGLAFGAPAAGSARSFGAPAASGGFGAAPAPSSGASARLAFGAPAAASTLGARSIGFGSAPAAGSFGAPGLAFGAPAAGSAGAFGAPAASGGFGAALAPAFGTRGLGVAAAPSSGTFAGLAFGAPAAGSARSFGAPAASGGFGAAPAPSSGASARLAFGAPAAASTLGARSIGSGSAGAFGAPAGSGGFGAASAPAFGASTAPTVGVSTAPSFGTTPPGGFASPAASDFGQPAAFRFGTAGGFRATPGVPVANPRFRPAQTVEQSKHAPAQTLNIQAISSMDEYKDKCFEELHWEDKQLGNKGGALLPETSAFDERAAPSFGSPAAAFDAAAMGAFYSPAKFPFDAIAATWTFGWCPLRGFGMTAWLPGAGAAGGFGALVTGGFGTAALGGFASPAASDFGQPAAFRFGTAGGFRATSGVAVAIPRFRPAQTVEQSKNAPAQTLNIQAISSMDEYKDKCFEELHWEDKQLGNKGNTLSPEKVTFGAPAAVAFGDSSGPVGFGPLVAPAVSAPAASMGVFGTPAETLACGWPTKPAVSMRHELVDRLQQRTKDIETFEVIAREYLQEPNVLRCISALRGESPASFYLATPSAEVEDASKLLSFESQTSSMKSNANKAIQRLRDAPLNNEPMGALLSAVSYSSPTHITTYRAFAIESLRRFCDSQVDGRGCWSPLVALVLSRLSNDATGACIRLCDPIAFATLLSPQEKSLLTPPSPLADTAAAAIGRSLDTINSQYERIKSHNNGQSWDALEAVMQMIGLRSMKELVLRAVESMCHVQKLPVASRVPQFHHFALLGNPGTGKSTVARHLATLLHQLQIRSNAIVVETTGVALAQMSPGEASRLFDSALGGTLVIDEAYALNPKPGQSSGDIAVNLLDFAESKRSEVSIVIIGDKDDMENALFQFSSGFARRFPYQITFDDYTDEELGTIFNQLLQSYQWTAASPKVLEVAARRVGRGRGYKSFGNAGDLRILFEAAYQRAVARSSLLVMEIEDIVGPPPTPEHIPALQAALQDLDRMVGLETVKQRIGKLVDQASINYRLEIDGKKPTWTPLNAVFLGNPGTGKTTVAKIYGRILKCLGLLTDGTCELKRPVDFIGSYVGETAKKTSQLVRTCKGRVLIVDEAHGFHGSSYGKEAMDALIRLVHNAPGEDIAVIFVGGRNDMETMFRAHHPGLARCFSLPTAFVFEDFDDMDLEEIALHALQKTGDITAPLDVVLALVKSVTVQRLAPTFGNAGTMIAAVQQALQRMSARDPCAMELTMSDVTGDQAVPTDPLECLSTLCKTDHLVHELRLLQAGMEQQRRDGVDTRGSLKNYLFLGSAGTGKTTAARTMATILHAWGLLHRNVVVTRTAQDLHGSNLGQTKDKVNAAMAEASGGVLFIDEASDLFGETPDAVDQLIARMTEPEHSGRTVVILAGYKQAMDEMIRHCSGGFCSHFTGRIEFPNWDADDCLRYIRDICQQEGRPLEANAETLLYDAFRVAGTHPSWSNARDCVTMQKLLYHTFAARNVQGCVTTNSYSIEIVQSAMDEWQRLRPTEVDENTVATVPMSMLAICPGPTMSTPPTREQDIIAASQSSNNSDTPDEEEEDLL